MRAKGRMKDEMKFTGSLPANWYSKEPEMMGAYFLGRNQPSQAPTRPHCAMQSTR